MISFIPNLTKTIMTTVQSAADQIRLALATKYVLIWKIIMIEVTIMIMIMLVKIKFRAIIIIVVVVIDATIKLHLIINEVIANVRVMKK